MGRMKDLSIEIDNMKRELPKGRRWQEILSLAQYAARKEIERALPFYSKQKLAEINVICGELIPEYGYVLDTPTPTSGGEGSNDSPETGFDETAPHEPPDVQF